MPATRSAVSITLLFALVVGVHAQVGKVAAIACDSQGRVHLLVNSIRFPSVIHETWSEDGWSEPVTVAQGRMPITMDVVVGADDVVYAVWSDIVKPNDSDVFHATYADGKWSAPVNVSNSPGFDWGAKIALTDVGTVLVVWQKVEAQTNANGFSVSGWGNGLQARSCADGQWGEIQTLTEAGEGFPGLAKAPNGEVHAFCAAPDQSTRALCEIVWKDGRWGEPVVAEAAVGVDPGAAPCAAFDATGAAHIALNAGPGRGGPGGPCYTRQTDGKWAPLTPLCQGMGQAAVGIAAGPDGTLHMVWTGLVGGRGTTCYSQFRDGAWGQAASVAHEMPRAYALAVDGAGVVHILADGMLRPKHFFGDLENGWEGDTPGQPGMP